MHILTRSSEQPHKEGSIEVHCFEDEEIEAQRGYLV